MRLVIHNRQGSASAGLNRYNGSGIFGSLGRKLFSFGLKKVINAAEKANLPQKVADVIVNGARSTGEKLGKTAGKKLKTVVRKGVKRKLGPLLPRPQTSKHSKVNFDHIINSGSGIVLD